MRAVTRNSVGIGAATAAITLATVLPFLPGPYDAMAAPLSLMSQVFGVSGLLLMPVGAVWVASAHWRPLVGKQYGIALVALGLSSLVWFTVLLGAVATSGPVLAVLGVVLWMYAVAWCIPRLQRSRSVPRATASPIAIYFLIVPGAVAALQMVVFAPALEFSRNRAIRNSGALIADIEQYRAANGRYPESLMSVNEDYHPGLLGIQGYKYELQGEAYNLFFEQPSLQFGVREFVMYNPLDQHALSGHKMDRLQLTPAQLALDRTRGHNALHDTAHRHWKYFWFD